MKRLRYLPVLLFFALPFVSGAQVPDSLRACLDSAIVYAKTFALYRHSVSWDQLTEELHWRASLDTNVLGMRPVLQFFLEQLHDPHGRFFYQGKPIAWYQGEPAPYQQHIDPRVWGVIQSGKTPFQSAMLPGLVGYLRIVGMPTGDNAQLAAPIRAAVCSLLAQGARQWIVDLRYNGGGNMFPMLAGISNILGEGEIGGSMDFTGNRFSTWKIKNGDVYYNDHNAADLDHPCPVEGTPKVAVLTSRYTVSSGEVLAVAFKGRPNTRFFGEHTAGFTTELGAQQLPAGVQLSIAVSFYADRDGRVYKTYVDVDEEAPFNPDAAPEQDGALFKALNWLK